MVHTLRAHAAVSGLAAAIHNKCARNNLQPSSVAPFLSAAPPPRGFKLRCTTQRPPLRIRASSMGPPGGGTGALTPELREALDKYLNENKVVLFMKGNKMFPQCGFSNTCVQILNNLNVPYETVNILEDDSLRQGMKEYSSWPTFPQLYIDGEFFGGCDITHEAFLSGELKEVLEKALLS